MRKILGALALVALLAGCGDSDAEGSDSKKGAAEETSPFVLAYNACKDLEVGNEFLEDEMVRAGSVMQVEDDALIIDGAGDQYVSGPTANCVLDELDAPATVRSQIESTTAMMGRQSDTWGEYEATWSFHPDNGLDLVIGTSS